jgi:hypothetical protein
MLAVLCFAQKFTKNHFWLVSLRFFALFVASKTPFQCPPEAAFNGFPCSLVPTLEGINGEMRGRGRTEPWHLPLRVGVGRGKKRGVR